MKKWLKKYQIKKNVNLFPYNTTNLHSFCLNQPIFICGFTEQFFSSGYGTWDV